LISEICDPRTKALVAIADVSDYVVSSELISMALAQVSERREINKVLSELFSAEGQEIYLRYAGFYCVPGECVSFLEIMYRVRKYRETAIGFKKPGNVAVLNPPEKRRKMEWGYGDLIIVLALD